MIAIVHNANHKYSHPIMVQAMDEASFHLLINDPTPQLNPARGTTY